MTERGSQPWHSDSSVPLTAVLGGLPGACRSEGILSKIYVMGWQQDVGSLIYRCPAEEYTQGRSPNWCLELAWLRSPGRVRMRMRACVYAHTCMRTHLVVGLLKNFVGHRQASEK